MPLAPEEIEVDDYAIVFSGGGALGAWEVGGLQTIFDYHGKKWPRIVTGASAGALNAAGLCAGLTPEELADEWRSLKNDQVFTQGVSVRKTAALLSGARGWRAARDSVLGALGTSVEDESTVLSSALNILRGHRGFYNTTPFKSTLERILKGREHTFLASPLRIAISTTKLSDGAIELFYKIPYTEDFPPQAATGQFAKAWKEMDGLTKLIQALIGTTALPLLFPPMAERFDGGVLMNQPISPALRLGARRIYVMIPSPESFHPTENLADIAKSLLTNWLAASLESQVRMLQVISWTDRTMLEKLEEDGEGDSEDAQRLRDRLIQLVVIRPPTALDDDDSIGLLKFGSGVDAMLASGKTATEERLKRFDPDVAKTWDSYIRHPTDAA